VALVVSFTPHAFAQTATTTPSDASLTETITDIPFDPLNPDHIEAKLREDFADVPVMVQIAKCESNFRQFDFSGNPLYGGTGGMAGIFQVAAAIHNDTARDLDLDINTVEGNIGYARYLYENKGTVPWRASQHCWGPKPALSVLKLGSVGKQVKLLQEMLNRNGFVLAKAGDGSPGQETTAFGPMTRDAVKKFQCAVRIACSGSEKTNGYGMVGVKTRQALLTLDAKNALGSSAHNLSKY